MGKLTSDEVLTTARLATAQGVLAKYWVNFRRPPLPPFGEVQKQLNLNASPNVIKLLLDSVLLETAFPESSFVYGGLSIVPRGAQRNRSIEVKLRLPYAVPVYGNQVVAC